MPLPILPFLVAGAKEVASELGGDIIFDSLFSGDNNPNREAIEDPGSKAMLAASIAASMEFKKNNPVSKINSLVREDSKILNAILDDDASQAFRFKFGREFDRHTRDFKPNYMVVKDGKVSFDNKETAASIDAFMEKGKKSLIKTSGISRDLSDELYDRMLLDRAYSQAGKTKSVIERLLKAAGKARFK